MNLINKVIDNLPDWVYYTIGVMVTVIIFFIGIWTFMWMFYFVSKILPTP